MTLLFISAFFNFDFHSGIVFICRLRSTIATSLSINSDDSSEEEITEDQLRKFGLFLNLFSLIWIAVLCSFNQNIEIKFHWFFLSFLFCLSLSLPLSTSHSFALMYFRWFAIVFEISWNKIELCHISIGDYLHVFCDAVCWSYPLDNISYRETSRVRKASKITLQWIWSCATSTRANGTGRWWWRK